MTSPSDAAREYASTHIERFTQELKEMLRFPSLSGDPAHAGDIRAMAEWLAAHLDEIGCANVAVMPTGATPSSMANGWAPGRMRQRSSSTATMM